MTIPLDKAAPLTCNITIIKKTIVFSKTFVISGEYLPIELIKGGANNQMTSCGLDFRNTGSYHIEGPFLNDNAGHTTRAGLTVINSTQPRNPIVHEFTFRTAT